MVSKPVLLEGRRTISRIRVLSLAVAGLLATLPLPAVAPRPSGAAITLPLQPLGYEPPQVRYLTAGATMFTLNFVDTTHLLLTFNSHALMPRLAGEPADDDDRLVAAVLLGLPAGDVLARTTWRMHDHDRYLWPLGHGRFLLRQRTALTVLAPLDGLATGDAFHETPFTDVKRRIGHISVSPEGDLLTVQTIPPPEPPLFGAAASAAALAATQPGYKKPEPVSPPDPAVRISIYRLRDETQPNGRQRLFARQVGLIRAAGVIHIAATGEGYLNTMKQSDGSYAFDFVTHDGKKTTELPAYLTACLPRAYFISRSEFVAFGCRASEDKPQFSEFDLRGQQPWISNAPGIVFAPYIDPAPAAGRFAYSHVAISGAYFDPDNVTADELAGQEVTVYQNHDGRTLLKVQTTPIQRAGQNFDLSPDGMQLAILRDGKIEVYNLPELTGKDKAEIKLAEAAAPPKNDGPILLNSVAVAPAQPGPAVTVATDPAAGKSQTAGAMPGEQSTASPVAPAEQNVVGDVPPSGPRKAPSLYGPGYPK